MLARKTLLGWTTALAVGALFLSQAVSQDQPAPGGGGRGGDRAGGERGGRQRFDPAQMRQQMTERMKTAMGATDDEWKVLGPKIEAVQTAQRDTRGGGGMGMMFGRGGAGGRGGRGGAPGGDAAAGGNRPAPDMTNASETQKASLALSTLLQKEGASAAEIKTALQALRDARAASEAKLVKAQAELKEIVTIKQEAQLVMMGMLK